MTRMKQISLSGMASWYLLWQQSSWLRRIAISATFLFDGAGGARYRGSITGRKRAANIGLQTDDQASGAGEISRISLDARVRQNKRTRSRAAKGIKQQRPRRSL